LQSVAVAAFRIVSWNKDVIMELVFNIPVTYNTNSPDIEYLPPSSIITLSSLRRWDSRPEIFIRNGLLDRTHLIAIVRSGC